VFSNEVAAASRPLVAGETIEVRSATDRLLGIADYNPHSLIAARILSPTRVAVDKEFLAGKLTDAWDFRRRIYPGEDSYRLVFGESDSLPGLVIDKYQAVLVLQALTMGMEKRLPVVVCALREVFNPQAIYERNDSRLRALEGLPQRKGLVWGTLPSDLTIAHDGLLFRIDVQEGQKTGFYFDQRENRRALAAYAGGARALDCFCNTGAFSLFAASFGAKSVLGIDSSEQAIETARVNAALNSLSAICRFETGDVLKFLESATEQYDLVVLDPPAFARTRQQLPDAARKYEALNTLAMRRTRRAGILVSCSCSHHLDAAELRTLLARAARRARRTLRLLEFRTQARDHPVLLAMRETSYLKCAILEVL
jgi:23S rRNA (cytosine1962-C5)-methyltransferase